MPAAGAKSTTKRLGRRLLFGLNLLLLLPMALAMLAPYISPENGWLPTVMSLGYPVWLLLPVLLAVAWLPFSKRNALFNALFLTLNFPVWGLSWQSNAVGPADDRDLRVFSYNVDAFGYKQDRLEDVVERIRPLDPQILCLQEFRNNLDGDHQATPYIKRELKYKHHAFVELVPKSGFGLMVFSRFPIVNSGRIDADTINGNGMMFADLALYGDTLRVYNMHLLSYRFSVGQRNVLGYSELKSHSTSRRRKTAAATPDARSLWQVVKVMLKAWAVHVVQTKDFLKHQPPAGRAALICADLNNPPYTWVYRQIRGDYSDLFVERGKGLGRTWGKGLVSFRIDYLFCNQRLRPQEFRVMPNDGLSDHSPLYARLRFDFH